MRILMKVSVPHEAFNAAVRDGSVASKMAAIVEALGPEAVYYTEMNGRRTAILIVEMANASQIPSLVEPWFLTFGADVELHPVMSPQDLQQAGLEGLGKKWG